MTPIEYEPSPDPLYRNVPLPHRTTIPVLGIPVGYASNAPAVIEAAEEAFGRWRTLEERPELVSPAGVRVQLMVHPGEEGAHERTPVRHRAMTDGRVFFSTPGSFAVSDPERAEVVGWVTPSLVADRRHFRHMILEALTLCLLTSFDRQPFHAAAVARGGAAVLMAGRGGVGKSTLTYAAARAGMKVLSEDTVYLQSEPRLRVWGHPRHLRLPLDARRHFPELEELSPVVFEGGEEKLAVELAGLDALPDPPVAERVGLCVVQRSGAGPGLERIDPEAATRELMRDLEVGFDRFADTLAGPVALLAARDAWRLELSDDPADALPLLDEALKEVGRRIP